METVSFRRTSDLAKMLGTLTCIIGAVTMTLFKGMALYQRPSGQGVLHHGFEFEYLHLSVKHLGLPQALQFKIGYEALGVLCLFLNCTSWGLYLINQVHILLDELQHHEFAVLVISLLAKHLSFKSDEFDELVSFRVLCWKNTQPSCRWELLWSYLAAFKWP